MKFALAVSVCVAMVFAQNTEVTPKTTDRNLPADILRDFPGACFASTACRVFQVGESWPLTPFCGTASCIKDPKTGALVERVQDCGLRPKVSPGCTLINQDALNGTFPTCCPKYSCEPGAELIYPTEEELKAAVAQTATIVKSGSA